MRKFYAGAITGAMIWWVLPTIIALPLLVLGIVSLAVDKKED